MAPLSVTDARFGLLHCARRTVANDALARLASAVATLALVVAALHALTGTGTRRPPPSGHVVEAVFLTAPPLPVPSPPPVSAVPAPAASVPVERSPRAARATDATAFTPATQPADAQPAAPRLAYGSLLGDSDRIAFGERPAGQRDTYRTPFESRPGRFRMRRKITPEDVVRGFAQLVGLWPPGYTDSPCPAIRKLIAATPETPSPRELDLLQDAVLAREQFCS